MGFHLCGRMRIEGDATGARELGTFLPSDTLVAGTAQEEGILEQTSPAGHAIDTSASAGAYRSAAGAHLPEETQRGHF